jgi:hypothetical protein
VFYQAIQNRQGIKSRDRGRRGSTYFKYPDVIYQWPQGKCTKCVVAKPTANLAVWLTAVHVLAGAEIFMIF